MGKPRRPRGNRPAWEPKPPAVADVPALAKTGPETSAIATAAAPTEAAGADPAPVDPAVPNAPESHPDSRPESESCAAATPAEAPVPADAATVIDAPAQPAAPTVSADDAAPETPSVSRAPTIAGAAPLQRIVFSPERWDVIEIGSTIARYMRGEGEAAMAHFRALSDARTPADVIRLQVGEVQRAADASLTCWVTVIGKASRVVAFR